MGEIIQGPWGDIPPKGLTEHGGRCTVKGCTVIIQPMPGLSLGYARQRHFLTVHSTPEEEEEK